MDIAPSVAADLTELTAALGEPGADLIRSLDLLTTSARLAVASYLGVTVTIVAGGYPVRLVAVDGPNAHVAIATSAELPLPVMCDVEAGSSIVFYASQAGAFVDFAADVAFMLGLPLDTMTLDQHQGCLDTLVRPTGLDDVSVVNQAVGVLINSGHTVESARTDLALRADHQTTTTIAMARQIVQQAITNPGLCASASD